MFYEMSASGASLPSLSQRYYSKQQYAHGQGARQTALTPMCGRLFVFRGRGGGLIKVIWHDGQGACLFTNDRRSYYTSFLAS
ncbi:hypothetical protein G9X64_04465 [Rhizobium sophorae]|uniref:IS66 family insertion sequence transposase domain-containing protein n=3 Tax=Rhizobium/Agrobacterium group TaxID=227290 RepID=A0A7Y3S2D4_9HYPH|nr:hypothetical protein [Rhizobium sophorae]PCK83225.1 hypothetical protein CPT32_30470 [Rhizobium sophoriradicis]PDS71827.1 hypothetical protein CO667_33880 [Rhizobium sp. L43]